MKFATFLALCEKSGLAADTKNWGHHWLIRGGRFSVNFYPATGRIYVNGMTSAKHGTPQDAIRMALEQPDAVAKKDPRRSGSYKSERRRMLRKSQVCHWCGKRLTLSTSTLDHRIPLGMGGADRRDNYVLACEPCNKARGCSPLSPREVAQEATE